MLSLLLVTAAEPTLARNSSRSSGGSGHSHSGKSASGYIVRHCKTEACFKKHPTGTYGFVPGQRKRRD
jgi:hypothetical protein